MISWNTATKISVPKNYPTEAQAIFINTYTGKYLLCGVDMGPIPPPDVWQTVDLSPLGIPVDTVAVDMAAFLIISDGTGSVIPDLAVGFQAPGGPLVNVSTLPSPYVTAYDGQAIGISTNGGARTNVTRTVPVVDQKVQFGWLRGDTTTWPAGIIPAYPAGAAFGISISVDKCFS